MTTADLFGVQLPVLAAPVAGRPSSPAVVSAVASVGGLGFLAAGYKHLLISPSRTHRDALVDPRFSRTVLTRVFTGRPARGLHNGFIERHEAAAPLGYPKIHQLTRPLRTAAAQTAARTGPPAAVVTELAGSLQAGRRDLVVGGSARRQPGARPARYPA